MTTSLTERFRLWFAYEKDAHHKTLLSLQTVPVEQKSSPSFAKALTLFAHIMLARKMWLYRFGVLSEGIDDFFPQGLAVETVATLAEEVHKIWDGYLEKLDDKELERIFAYKSLDNGRFRNSIEEILTQLFGHSWYHRGQIAQLVKSLGGTPAVTDFVYWSREQIADVDEIA
jgi:uncharacterized damage-inducible protein DinB